MESIAYEADNCKQFSKRVQRFFQRFHLGVILKKCNAYKERGIPACAIFLYLFCLGFRNRSVYEDSQSSKNVGFAKDTVYRFKNSCHINWLRFTTLLSSAIIKTVIEPLSSPDRKNAFIIDDSIFERNRSKCVELLARVYDHAHKRYTKGFRMLTLCWSDGASLIPVNACLLSTENKSNRLVPAKSVQKQSNAEKIRTLAQGKATEVLFELLAQAKTAGIKAKYVLFDSWFSMPQIIASLKKKGYETVAIVKKTEKVFYRYKDKWMSDKAIYAACKKRRGCSKYLLSVVVNLNCSDDIPARLVFVRKKNKKSDYLVLICTDMNLSEEEIIQLYGKRWDIEVFFKTCKSILKLTSECRSISYDALCSQVAIVFARYMFLAVELRENKDLRSMGPLFCLVCDEISDISFDTAMERLQQFFQNLINRLNWAKEEVLKLYTNLAGCIPIDVSKMIDLNTF